MTTNKDKKNPAMLPGWPVDHSIQTERDDLRRQKRQATSNANDASASLSRCLTHLLTLYPDPKDQSDGRKLVNHLLFRWFPGW